MIVEKSYLSVKILIYILYVDKYEHSAEIYIVQMILTVGIPCLAWGLKLKRTPSPACPQVPISLDVVVETQLRERPAVKGGL